uniref:BSD domain-containing protein n=1 Tax=Ananas comosus var. bracteatus TaxID=296719 RepID=A0A6V7PBP7_ANACO|nr:unnamed protein product [Ananas comosus var. bracteatus]
MSWFAKSLVNSLISAAAHGDEEEEEEEEEEEAEAPPTDPHHRHDERSPPPHPHGGGEGGEGSREDDDEEAPDTPSRGVKDDLSELTPAAAAAESEVVAAESPRLAGIRSDFAEIGGKFRSGISMLSNAKAVSEISKIASSIIQFGSQEEEEEGDGDDYEGEELGEVEKIKLRGVGVTEEVLVFARNISMHPETWIDFPAFGDDEDSNDFEMSEAQQEHALAIEHLVPRIAALSSELCPIQMSEKCFWKIYFVLLHSRLNKHDAELLSTPQIVKARENLLVDLPHRTKPKPQRIVKEPPSDKENVSSSPTEEKVILPLTTQKEVIISEKPSIHEDVVTEKHPVETSEVKIVDKSIIKEELSTESRGKDLPIATSNVSLQKDEEDGDDWFEEEETGESNSTRGASIPILGNEEDVSFSDLEEEDNEQGRDIISRTAPNVEGSRTNTSRGWVQLNKGSPQTTEGNDWSDIEDIDVA